MSSEPRLDKSRISFENIIRVAVLAAYAALHICLVLHHEAWRDESQAWVLAHNLSFFEIPGICASEGHPCLWFYILKLCQACGMPFRYMGILSVLIMTVSAALLLWKSPFSLISDICILASPVFLYYNPVICRIYCVDVLLIVLLCIWWPRRRSSPVIYGIITALFFQTHILMAGFALGCLAEMVLFSKGYIKRRNMAGFLIPFVSMILMVLELRTTKDSETFIHIDAFYLNARFSNFPINEIVDGVLEHFNYSFLPAGQVFLASSILITAALIIMFIRNKKMRRDLGGIIVPVLCGVIYYWGIIIVVRSADHIQMAVILWMLILFGVWVTTGFIRSFWGSETKERYICEGIFVLCCLLALPKITADDIPRDLYGPFSGAQEIADIIVDNVPEGSVIVVRNDAYTPTVAAYLYDSGMDYVLWDIDNGREFSIHKWGRKNDREIDQTSLYGAICADEAGCGICYYLAADKILTDQELLCDQMVLIGRNDRINRWNEYYQLYEVEIS